MTQRIMLLSKIHRARVTETALHYEGSLTLDADLLKAANLFVHQQVQVYNVNTGERFETYVIPGPSRSGTVCLNGPAARLGAVGDLLIIAAYGLVEEAEAASLTPIIVAVDSHNRPLPPAAP